MAYTPIYKPNQLIMGNPDSQLVVVTGWTPRDYVAKHLNPDTYAAIGQLYNPTRGINFLLRNLLANPEIRWLVSIGVTCEDANAGAVQCLTDFFTHGVTKGKSDTGRECWVINSKVVGYIDLDIPSYDLEVLRIRIAHYPCDGVRDVRWMVDRLSEHPLAPVDGSPKTYPMTLPRSDTKPASLYGHHISGDTIADCWVKILHRIRLNGALRSTDYDGEIQELIDLVTVVECEPEGLHFPAPNYLPVTRGYIEQAYLKSVLEDADNSDSVKYTYGQRLRSWFGADQIEQAIAKLHADKDSTRVLMTLWDGTRDILSDAPPCLNTIWFRVVGNDLTLTATFRSNDMFNAWVANAMALRYLQQHIRDCVDPTIDLGPLVTISQSAHLYDDTLEEADRIVKAHHTKVSEYHDKVGYFIVEFSAGVVTVTQHHHVNGEVVDTYSGTKALPLIRRVIGSNPSIQPDHASYLGLEVARAFDQGYKYQQDKGG